MTFARPVVLALVSVVVLILALAGCSAAGVSASRSQVASALSSLDQARAAAVERLSAAEAAGDAAAAERARDTIASADAINGRLDQVAAALAAATNPDGSVNVGAAASAAAPFLPPPWNLVLLLGGPALAALIQELRVRRAVADAGSIVSGLEAAKAANPALGAALKASAPVLLEHYTDSAYAMVEAARP